MLRNSWAIVVFVMVAWLWFNFSGGEFITTLVQGGTRYRRDARLNASMKCIVEEYDKSKRYVILRNIFTANIVHRRDDITLLTQCDTGKLRYVIELAARWQGPVHVSLYFVTMQLKDRVYELVNNIRLCHSYVRNHVTWHFVYPAFERIKIVSLEKQKPIAAKRPKRVFDFALNDDDVGYRKSNPDCENTLLDEIADFKKHSVSVDPDKRNKNGTYIAYFPMNVLANIARTESRSEFVFFIDADLVPNSELRKNFLEFARRKNLFGQAEPQDSVATKRTSVRYLQWAKAAPPQTFIVATEPACPYHYDNEPYAADIYVVPTFQYKGPDDKIPATVKQLKRYHEEHKVTRYYDGCFFHPYGPTGHVYWLSLDMESQMDCAYEVKFFMNYEPYHIARRSYPMYDERFAGHGNVKVSHLSEVASLGYKFKVLNNAFLCHRGWKPKLEKEFHQKAQEYLSQKLTMEKKLDELEKAFNSSYVPVVTGAANTPPKVESPVGNPWHLRRPLSANTSLPISKVAVPKKRKLFPKKQRISKLVIHGEKGQRTQRKPPLIANFERRPRLSQNSKSKLKPNGRFPGPNRKKATFLKSGNRVKNRRML